MHQMAILSLIKSNLDLTISHLWPIVVLKKWLIVKSIKNIVKQSDNQIGITTANMFKYVW